ncbi:MAG: hypothetical protein EOO89_27150, partial [Pedobacter sp.]
SNLDNLNDYGGMAGIFKDKKKAAIYGTKSNIGLQSKVNNAMSSLKGSDYDIIEVSDDGSSIMMMGRGDQDDYMDPSRGVPDNLTLGAHFSDKWKDNKRNLKLNYKYLDRGIFNSRTSNNQQLLPNGTLFIGSGNAIDNSNNKGNDLKGNYEFTIDSLSKLKFSFGLRNTASDINTTAFSETHTSMGLNVNQNNQLNNGNGTNDTYNGNINYTKKFAKKGRSLTIDLQPEFIKTTELVKDKNTTLYYDAAGILNRTDNLDLTKDNDGTQNSIASKISFAEPISKSVVLQASYSFKNVDAESYRNTFDNTILVGGRPRVIDSLSNNFKFNSMSHIARGVLQWRNAKLSINGGLEATQTNFDLNDLDRANQFSRNYLNLAPTSNINYKIGRNMNVGLNYNGTTRQPSLSQLQPIRAINNPLYQVIGNPDLKPSFTNTVSLNGNSYNPKSQEYIFFNVYYT